MRIIFMGTPDFSVGTLEALVEAVYNFRHCDTSHMHFLLEKL